MYTGTAKVSLDFYAPMMDCRQLRREKLDRKRADMYTSSSDSYLRLNPESRKKAYDPFPKEVFIENTQRAAEHAKRVEIEESGAARWPEAGVIPCNRCRLWRENGFRFDTAHFQASQTATRAPHRTGRPLPRSVRPRPARARPFEPYFHDMITLCEVAAPMPAPTPAVHALAVTCNRAEAERAPPQAAADAAQSLASRRHCVELAESIHADLARHHTGPLATAEVAYSLRPAFFERRPSHRVGSLAGGEPAGLGAAPLGRSLPTEAKALRVYAIRLKRTLADADMRMVQPQELPREGVPVLLSELRR